MIFEVIITNKTLKIIVFYNVGGSRTVYIDGENVGDMYDNIGIGLDVFFEGSLLEQNEHYEERGIGESDKIRFKFEVPKDSTLGFVIRK